MATANHFSVSLESLTAFTEELTTQLSGMGQPLTRLRTLTGGDLRLGQFPEADSLWHNHDVAADEMSVLVGQARDAVDFAKEITKSVTTAYQHYDDHVATGIGSASDTLGALTGALGGTAASVTGAVAPIAPPTTEALGDIATPITETVPAITSPTTEV